MQAAWGTRYTRWRGKSTIGGAKGGGMEMRERENRNKRQQEATVTVALAALSLTLTVVNCCVVSWFIPFFFFSASASSFSAYCCSCCRCCYCFFLLLLFLTDFFLLPSLLLLLLSYFWKKKEEKCYLDFSLMCTLYSLVSAPYSYHWHLTFCPAFPLITRISLEHYFTRFEYARQLLQLIICSSNWSGLRNNGDQIGTNRIFNGKLNLSRADSLFICSFECTLI